MTDDAGRVISGEAGKIVIEWGHMTSDGQVVWLAGEHSARSASRCACVQVVKRKVTYGEWLLAGAVRKPGEAP